VNPKCEGVSNPQAVTNLTPTFDAEYEDLGGSGRVATHYEIEVNTAVDFTGTVMWDTGKTAMSPVTDGNRGPSPAVSYSGASLALKGQTYYWRIRFWDDEDRQGPWSDVQSFTMSSMDSEWYDSGWKYRKRLTIDNTTSTSPLSDQWVEVALNSSNFDFSKAKSAGEDLRFTDSDGTSPIDFYIETYNKESSIATVYLNLPVLPALAEKTVYMYP